MDSTHRWMKVGSQVNLYEACNSLREFYCIKVAACKSTPLNQSYIGRLQNYLLHKTIRLLVGDELEP